MRRSRQQVLPDPWIDGMVHNSLNAAAAVSWGTGTWGGSDLAMYVPQVFPARCTVYALKIFCGTANGNYDLGMYDSQFRRLASAGSTAITTGVLTLTIPEITVEEGSLYYAALALSSGTAQILRLSYTPAYPAISAGIATEASALPLPATATPVVAARSLVPVFTWGIR